MYSFHPANKMMKVKSDPKMLNFKVGTILAGGSSVHSPPGEMLC